MKPNTLKNKYYINYLKQMLKSPLRYPGGKTRAISTLNQVFNDNFNINNYDYIISPFCGGCSFELNLLSKFNDKHFIFSDLFEPLIIFWQQVQNDNEYITNELSSLVNHVNKQDFNSYREDLMELMNNDELNIEINKSSVAIEYFVINRCSFSGSTFSGGFSSESSKKRFTISSVNNIKCLNNKLNNIQFLHQTFEETFSLIRSLTNENHKIFLFCDPPYHLSKSNSKLYGVNGDLHVNFNHNLLYQLLMNCNCDYILTYNDSNYIRELYKNNIIINAEWSYGMNKSHKSSEIIILSKKNVAKSNLIID